MCGCMYYVLCTEDIQRHWMMGCIKQPRTQYYNSSSISHKRTQLTEVGRDEIQMLTCRASAHFQASSEWENDVLLDAMLPRVSVGRDIVDASASLTKKRRLMQQAEVTEWDLPPTIRCATLAKNTTPLSVCKK